MKDFNLCLSGSNQISQDFVLVAKGISPSLIVLCGLKESAILMCSVLGN